MPPRQDAKATVSRSRLNRVTHKTRLRVLVGNHDVDPILDDGEHIDYHTHGVEAHESTEIHLQRSLSVTTLRALGGQTNKPEPKSNSRKHQQQHQHQTAESHVAAAAIPIPDASGLVDDSQLYPHGKFTDTALYIKFSDTVEESIAAGLAGTYTYYLDERDKAWLDKNNQAARGEGSSSQATRALASPIASTSQLRRNGKSKEADLSPPPPPVKAVEMSEDEFELVMGLFERRAAEPPFFFTPDAFPSMDVYEEWFSDQLAADLFAAYTVPKDVPDPDRLLELARCVYAHWKERRIERSFQNVMPHLNLHDSVINDSYTCFRRRELRPVRRTRRQADAGVADPLLQLRKELNACLDVARLVAKREVQKRELVAEIHSVADLRIDLAQAKLANPTLGDRTDEMLLYEKEPRQRKRKPPIVSLSINTAAPKRHDSIRIKRDTAERASPATVLESCNIAQQRAEEIAAAIDRDLARQKQEDVGHEDGLDFPFKRSTFLVRNDSSKVLPQQAQPHGWSALVTASLALRAAQAPALAPPSTVPAKRAASDAWGELDEENDRKARQQERWKFDSDGLEPDIDAHRMLVDDMSALNIRSRAHLLLPSDLSLILSTNENTRGHFDYRHGHDDQTSWFNHALICHAATSLHGCIGCGPAAGSAHAVTPTSSGVGAGHPVPPLPSLATPPMAQQAPAKLELPVTPVFGRDPPSSPTPVPPLHPQTATIITANVPSRSLNGTIHVAVPPLPSLSQASPAPATRQSGNKAAANGGTSLVSVAGVGPPAKARLRLADNDTVQVKGVAQGRARSKPADELVLNGKAFGGHGPPLHVLENRSNGHTHPKVNGHSAINSSTDATLVNGNGSSRSLNGRHAHSPSRSPSTESAGGRAASEAGSQSAGSVMSDS
ncbi:hypothetical protein BKA62DRAFT_764144 [Auriculariales sp. MPI-PUGE-AT-0066]|nr:hypothetical protein BKA62DRAFT_764144 [Auriculariales sp. MPI-PUGE-AT-0066]